MDVTRNLPSPDFPPVQIIRRAVPWAEQDSGKFLPGIGGALDLVDSLLFSLPVFYGYLILTGRV